MYSGAPVYLFFLSLNTNPTEIKSQQPFLRENKQKAKLTSLLGSQANLK